MSTPILVRDLFEFLAEHGDRISEALSTTEAEDDEAGRGAVRRVILHGHCQQKTAGWMPPAQAVLGRLPGLRVESTAAECCGMAGSFGYKTFSYEVSRELGHRLVGEIEQLEAMTGEPVAEVFGFGTSCRAQLRDFGSHRVRHPVELLEDVLGRAGL